MEDYHLHGSLIPHRYADAPGSLQSNGHATYATTFRSKSPPSSQLLSSWSTKPNPTTDVSFVFFSMGFFCHEQDSNCSREQFEAQTLSGIAMGYSNLCNSMMFWSPDTGRISMSSDYRLNPLCNTADFFCLHYDGGIKCGLLSTPEDALETFPPGMSVSVLHNMVPTHGMVLTVPLASCTDDADHRFYTIHLATGDTLQFPESALTPYPSSHPPPNLSLTDSFSTLPPWIRHNQKMTIHHNGQYHQVFQPISAMEYCTLTEQHGPALPCMCIHHQKGSQWPPHPCQKSNHWPWQQRPPLLVQT